MLKQDMLCAKNDLYYKFILFFIKAKKGEIQLAAIELRNGKLFFFLVFLQSMVQFYFFHF